MFLEKNVQLDTGIKRQWEKLNCRRSAGKELQAVNLSWNESERQHKIAPTGEKLWRLYASSGGADKNG